MKIVLKCQKVVSGVAEGEAVVTKEPVSFLGGSTRTRGWWWSGATRPKAR